MNKCFFGGRLTRDPVYKESANGVETLAYTMAIQTGYGEHEETMFLDCIMYGASAARYNDKLYKGVKIIAEGSLYSYSYTDRDSKKVEKKALKVKDCEIMMHTKAYMEAHPSNRDKKESTPETGENWEGWNVSGMSGRKSSVKSGVGHIGRYGIPEDEDGFMVVDEEDTDLPFN